MPVSITPVGALVATLATRNGQRSLTRLLATVEHVGDLTADALSAEQRELLIQRARKLTPMRHAAPGTYGEDAPSRPAGPPHPWPAGPPFSVDTPRASLTFGATGLDRALDELPLPAWLVDRDGRFRWINEAGILLIGRWVGRLFVNVVAPEHVHTARLAFARKVVGDTPSDIELILITTTGERVNVRVASVPVRQDDRVVAIFGVAYVVRGNAKQRMEGARRQPDVPTARQREVLVLLAQGLTTRGIAERLGIAHETARNHVRGLLHALGVHSRLHAVTRGYQLGLIPGDEDE